MSGASVVRSVNNIMSQKVGMVPFSDAFSGRQTALQEPAAVDYTKRDALQEIVSESILMVNNETMMDYLPFLEMGIIPVEIDESKYQEKDFNTTGFQNEFTKRLESHVNLANYFILHGINEQSSPAILSLFFNRLMEIPNLVDLIESKAPINEESKKEITDKLRSRNKKALADIFPQTLKTIENHYRDASVKLKDEMLEINRSENGSFEFLPPQGYFALTKNTPMIDNVPWTEDQILIKSPEDLIKHADIGKQLLQQNSAIPGLSTATLGMPIAGTASRALKFALENPDLLKRIEDMGALETLGKNELPPRYLYPIETTYGVKTLCGLFLKHFIEMGNDAGVLSPVFAIFSEAGQKLTIERLKNELKMTDDQLNVMFGFLQPVAQRVFASDKELTEKNYVTGHGDYSTKFAQLKMYEAMVQMGVKYFAFSNADEFMSQGDYTLYSVFETLKARGYKGMVIAVPNSNNQLGGGIGEDKYEGALQKYAYLREAPMLPPTLIEKGNNPKSLNTTIYLFDTEALAEVSDDLLIPSPGLDMKNEKGRKGGIEQALCLETWAGTEWTEKLARKYPIAYVYAPRAGIFTGIKSLEHTISDGTPPELAEFPVHSFKDWTYRKLVSHMASTYRQVVSEIANGNIGIAQEVYNNGFSYLIEPELLKELSTINPKP